MSMGGNTPGGMNAGGAAGSGGGTSTDSVKSEGCGKATTLKSGNGQRITVGGTNRTYNIRIPEPYDSNKPYRLILGYHGMTLNANTVTNESFYGLWNLSAGSTIFVAPQGLNDAWPNTGGADVEFSRQLIASLESQLCIDKSRIFAQGFSMGGSMSYAMACAAGDIIRAIAVHSGGPMSGCVSHNKPVAYFMTHGTRDDICTYPRYGVPELQDFAKVNGCKSPDPGLSASNFAAALPEPTGSSGSCIDFEGCSPGYPARSCIFVGTHIWNPGNWVPGEVWKFFTQF
jgi:poly(3-hydroxybutyrate) depolymerase